MEYIINVGTTTVNIIDKDNNYIKYKCYLLLYLI